MDGNLTIAAPIIVTLTGHLTNLGIHNLTQNDEKSTQGYAYQMPNWHPET